MTQERRMFDVATYLAKAGEVILPGNGKVHRTLESFPKGHMHVGVDLGTAYLVLVVLDEEANRQWWLISPLPAS